MSYLWFVTLNTGRGQRLQLLPDRPDAAALDLGRALRDGSSPVSGQAGYSIEARTVGSSLLCTIYKADLPVTVFGVAARSLNAAKLWDLIHDDAYGLATDAGKPPRAPWCAVRVEPGLLTDPDAASWLAGYEADIAFAWLERHHA